MRSLKDDEGVIQSDPSIIRCIETRYYRQLLFVGMITAEICQQRTHVRDRA